MCFNGLMSMRCFICWMLFGVFTITSSLRGMLSMSIVLMLRPDGIEPKEGDGYLDWPKNAKGLVLLLPLIGSLVCLPFYMKFLADRRSPKKIISIIILSQSLLSLISPITAKASFSGFLVIRFLIGIGEGCVGSCIHTIGGRWFPARERSFKVAAYTCGLQIAFGFANYFVSFLSTIGLSWEYAFYFFGILGLIFGVAFLIFVTDSPNGNKFISKIEESYLSEEIHQPAKNTKRNPTPWKAMVTSAVVYSHILCMVTVCFTTAITSNFLPLYFDSELKISISKSGGYTLIPFTVQLISKLLYGVISYVIIRRKIVNATQSTKICQTISSFGSAVALMMLPFTNETWVIVALALYGLTFAAGTCGYYTSQTLIAPRFTGSISAQMLFLGFMASTVPMIIYEVLDTWDVANKYVYMFAMAAFLQALSGVIYLIWGSAEEQPWAKVSTVSVVPLTSLEDTA